MAVSLTAFHLQRSGKLGTALMYGSKPCLRDIDTILCVSCMPLSENDEMTSVS